MSYIENHEKYHGQCADVESGTCKGDGKIITVEPRDEDFYKREGISYPPLRCKGCRDWCKERQDQIMQCSVCRKEFVWTAEKQIWAKKRLNAPEAFQSPTDCKRCQSLDPIQREIIRAKTKQRGNQEAIALHIHEILASEGINAKMMLRDSAFIKQALMGIREARMTVTYDENYHITKTSYKDYAWLGNYRYIKHYKGKNGRLVGYTFFKDKWVEHYDPGFRLTGISMYLSPTHVVHYDPKGQIVGESFLKRSEDFINNNSGTGQVYVENRHYDKKHDGDGGAKTTRTYFYNPTMFGKARTS